MSAQPGGSAAGRADHRSGRGGTCGPANRRLLPGPAPAHGPCCPAAEAPRRREPMGARDLDCGCQSPGGSAGRAHLLARRAAGECVPELPYCPGGGDRGKKARRPGQLRLLRAAESRTFGKRGREAARARRPRGPGFARASGKRRRLFYICGQTSVS